MNILKPRLFLIFTSLVTISSFAQHADLQIKKNHLENCVPFTQVSNDLYNEIVQKDKKNRNSVNHRSTYTIPVVFHIVHNNGPENISDEQIYSAIDILNEDFSMKNPDLVNVPDAFVDLIANANVNFELSKQAPNGSCTTGINRYFSGYEIDSLGNDVYWTDDGKEFADEIKSTYYWDVDKYLNIYVVNNSENSGLSSFPYQVEALLNSKKWFDGIIIRHYNLGNTGTALDNLEPHVLSHEVGHYLDLLHTWGSKSHPESSELDWEIDCDYKSKNCPDYYCTSDDLVEDTPNTKYTGGGCIYEMTSCGTTDNITNIMAYGCQLMFTNGQVKRMHKALNSNIGNRNNLWSDENLNYTLNCTETPSEKICEQIHSSFISYFEVLHLNSGIILADVENTTIKIRYKINDEDWTELPETTLNYYLIDNIEKCAQYELQISEKCGDMFSPWSGSRFFYTNGEDIPKASMDKFSNIIEKQDATSFNTNDGSITINTINGIAPYTFNWSTGDTTSTLNNIPAGEYHVTVFDAYGCSVTDTIFINGGVCNSLIVNVSITDQTYFNEDNGSILIEVENGIMPYNISWNTGDSLLQLNNLSPGEYSFLIEDAIGCKTSDTLLISPVVCDSFLVAIDFEEESFVGANDATINLVALNAVSPVQYYWSTGDTTATIDSLTTGDYIFTLTDAKGCNITDTLSIATTYCEDLTVNVVSTNLTDSNTTDATALAFVSGGAAPYSFNWSTGDTLAAISDLSAGTYTVEVIDDNLCRVEASVNIYNYDCDNFDVDLKTTYAKNSSYASIFLESHNGFDPLQILWSTGDTNDRIVNLPSGNYSINITDSIGCVYTDTITILNPSCEDFDIIVEYEGESFVDANDAIANVTVVNGIPPFQYNWSTGDTTEVIENLLPGVYRIQVYDSNGCSTVKNITIAPFDCSTLTYKIETSPESYKNAQNGTVNVIVDSLNAPYKFYWSTGDTLSQLTGLQPGIYYFSLTDKNGCEVNDSLIINEVNCDDFSATISIENATCGNFNDGSLQLLGFENAAEPVNYFWNKDSLLNENLITGLSEGFYFFDAIDNAGCGFNAALRITNDTEIFIETFITPESWKGSNDGSILVTLEGGVEPYTYNWSTKDSTNFVSNLSAGLYTLTVTDAEGCTVRTNDLLVETSLLCPKTSIITSNENLISNTYQAKNSIESNAVIGVGENVTFKASNLVTLTNDFEVPKGADFSIEIGACE